MELQENQVDYTSLIGSQIFNVSSGKHLLIETSPGGEEILDAIVPTGKKWSVDIKVRINETDV